MAVGNEQSMRTAGTVGKPYFGLYGKPLCIIPEPTPPPSDGFRNPNALVAPTTHMQPSFGLAEKRERNIKRTRGVFRTNISPVFRAPNVPSGSGMKIVEASSAPSVQAYLHQTTHPERKSWAQSHAQVVQANRVSQNNTHRAAIRAAAPAQVAWKVPYVVGQRNVQPIGPYQSLQQKSILYRLSDYLASIGGG